jgi:hypothetical protein
VEESIKESSTLGKADEMPEAETVATSTEEVPPATEESGTMQPEPSPTLDEPREANLAQPETTQEAETECAPSEIPTSSETGHDEPAKEALPAEPKTVTAAPGPLPKFDVKSLVARFSLIAPMGAKKPAVRSSVEEPIKKKEVVEPPAGKFFFSSSYHPRNRMPNVGTIIEQSSVLYFGPRRYTF